MGHQWQASVTIYLTLLPLFTANCWQDFLLKVEDIKKKKRQNILKSLKKKKKKKPLGFSCCKTAGCNYFHSQPMLSQSSKTGAWKEKSSLQGISAGSLIAWDKQWQLPCACLPFRCTNPDRDAHLIRSKVLATSCVHRTEQSLRTLVLTSGPISICDLSEAPQLNSEILGGSGGGKMCACKTL